MLRSTPLAVPPCYCEHNSAQLLVLPLSQLHLLLQQQVLLL
jgi:hypothetical protein